MLRFRLDGIPACLWGTSSDQLYLYVHGQNGCKEEAGSFAAIAGRHGWQVLCIDLPGHGERGGEGDSFGPWHVVPELAAVMRYARSRWGRIALYANSIGAWFSMLSFAHDTLENCLFVSPVLDMERLITRMMLWAGVSEEQLESERRIPTAFGQTLSWDYLLYAKSHPITKWNAPTGILLGGRDALTERITAEEFARKFHCSLSVMEKGEHWFHTEEQLEVLRRWTVSAFV